LKHAATLRPKSRKTDSSAGLLQPQIELRFRSVTVPFRVWWRI
jgi:hypothetical protein